MSDENKKKQKREIDDDRLDYFVTQNPVLITDEEWPAWKRKSEEDFAKLMGRENGE